MNNISIVPIGGLANRMLAVSSFISYCCDTQKKLRVIWVKDKGLNCSFEDLFEPLSLDNIEIKEAGFFDLVLHDRPKKRNLKLTRFLHPIFYQKRIYEEEYLAANSDLASKNQLLKSLDFYDNIYIVACCHLYDKEGMLNYLKPTSAVQKKIHEITVTFPPSVIGIHIRRTDNIRSIQNSPTELYIRKMDEEIERNPDVAFFVASDSINEKEKLIKIFGTKIITSMREVNRNSSSGITDALAEIYALSSTKKIIGSSTSTFAIVAGKISGIATELFA